MYWASNVVIPMTSWVFQTYRCRLLSVMLHLKSRVFVIHWAYNHLNSCASSVPDASPSLAVNYTESYKYSSCRLLETQCCNRKWLGVPEVPPSPAIKSANFYNCSVCHVSRITPTMLEARTCVCFPTNKVVSSCALNSYCL